MRDLIGGGGGGLGRTVTADMASAEALEAEARSLLKHMSIGELQRALECDGQHESGWSGCCRRPTAA